MITCDSECLCLVVVFECEYLFVTMRRASALLISAGKSVGSLGHAHFNQMGNAQLHYYNEMQHKNYRQTNICRNIPATATEVIMGVGTAASVACQRLAGYCSYTNTYWSAVCMVKLVCGN